MPPGVPPAASGICGALVAALAGGAAWLDADDDCGTGVAGAGEGGGAEEADGGGPENLDTKLGPLWYMTPREPPGGP